jgi:hypothetical protein
MLITARSEVDTKALHEAMKYDEHLYVVKILLENIGYPNSKDDEGKTLLNLARTKEVGAVLQEAEKKREDEKAKTDKEAVTKNKWKKRLG